jgi:hypothetical protein
MDFKEIQELVHIKFNQYMDEHFSLLKWFLNPFDDCRQTGRSTMSYCAYISLAIEHLGEWITPVSHVNTRITYKEAMVDYICDLMQRNPKIIWERKKESFRIKEVKE